MKLEYGLLIALIASVMVIGLTHLSAEFEKGFGILSPQLAPGGAPAAGDGGAGAGGGPGGPNGGPGAAGGSGNPGGAAGGKTGATHNQ